MRHSFTVILSFLHPAALWSTHHWSNTRISGGHSGHQKCGQCKAKSQLLYINKLQDQGKNILLSFYCNQVLYLTDIISSSSKCSRDCYHCYFHNKQLRPKTLTWGRSCNWLPWTKTAAVWPQNPLAERTQRDQKCVAWLNLLLYITFKDRILPRFFEYQVFWEMHINHTIFLYFIFNVFLRKVFML